MLLKIALNSKGKKEYMVIMLELRFRGSSKNLKTILKYFFYMRFVYFLFYAIFEFN